MSSTTSTVGFPEWYAILIFGILILGSFLVIQFCRPGSLVFKRRQFRAIFDTDPEIPIPSEAREKDVHVVLRNLALKIESACRSKEAKGRVITTGMDRNERQSLYSSYITADREVGNLLIKFKWAVRVARAYGVKTGMSHNWSDYLHQDELASQSGRRNAEESATRHRFHETRFERMW